MELKNTVFMTIYIHDNLSQTSEILASVGCVRQRRDAPLGLQITTKQGALRFAFFYAVGYTAPYGLLCKL